MQKQLDLFQNIEIMLGPHGAGLTNMLWAPNGTSVIEFPLKPHSNRNMAMLAYAANMDYWILPEINCNYYLKYTVDKNGVDAMIRLLKHIIDKRGLEYLYRVKPKASKEKVVAKESNIEL